METRDLVLTTSGKTFFTSSFEPAAVGNYGAFGIFVPAAAGKEIVLRSFLVSLSNANGSLNIDSSAVDATAGGLLNAMQKNLITTGGAVARVLRGNAAALASIFNAGVMTRQASRRLGAAYLMVELLQAGPIIVPADKGFVVSTSVVNVGLAAQLEWEELGG